MSKFWIHVDSFIPEEDKKHISDEEAKEQSSRASNALNRLQVRQNG